MFFLKLLKKLIKAISSGDTPARLAIGFVLGMLLGLTPAWGLIELSIVLFLIFVEINISMAICGYLLFSLIGLLLDPLFHSLGYWLLVKSDLREFWSTLYSLPLLPLTRFNNTANLGSLITALLISVPVYFLIKYFILLYRNKFELIIEKWKIVKLLKGSKIISLWNHISLTGSNK